MKETIHVGSTVWRKMCGTAILEINDFVPAEKKRQDIATIGHWKKRFGGTKAQLKHPFGPTFEFDFSHWSHLPDETYLKLVWKFVPDRPITRTDC